MIHPTAVIDPKAELDSSVSVGPYVVIGAGVRLGADCVVAAHVHMMGPTVVGRGNRFHTGCVVGDAPQDLKYKDEPSELLIGDDNVFREHVTLHRSNSVEEATVIGSGNFLMANSHVGHNSQVGDSVIVANGALLGGHVVVEDKVFISGNCLIHQFTRVGRQALMQGGSAISKDLPPYTIARGDNGMCGLNVIGLRRSGVTGSERLELKRLYHRLFRSEGRLSDLLDAVRGEFDGDASRAMIEFVGAAKRGVCRDTGGVKGRPAGEE